MVSEEDFNSEDVFVSNLNRNLFEWAEADIERYAERGCPAEEYIFSLLRWALLKVEVRDPRELYGNENLERALDELGLGGWLSQGSSDKECEAAGSKDRVRHLCLGIFTRLIERSLHDDICALKFSGKARLVEHLAYEVL